MHMPSRLQQIGWVLFLVVLVVWILLRWS